MDELLNKLVASGLSVHVVDDGDFKHRATARISHKDGTRGVKGQGKDACEAIEVAIKAAFDEGLIKSGDPAGDKQAITADDVVSADKLVEAIVGATPAPAPPKA